MVAVADAFGAVANEHGLQIPELREHLAAKHRWAEGCRVCVLCKCVCLGGEGGAGR